MKQLVFIHGGESFTTYEDYLEALRSWKYDPKKEVTKRWKDTLIEELGNQWEVLMPTMPNKYNAKYAEWKIWFKKVIPYINDDVLLVGYSLGGSFLVKYLSDETLSKKIYATFLVATPYDKMLAEFGVPDSLEQFEKQAGKVFLYHSEDDFVVPFRELAEFRAQLPEATVRVFTDRGHFLQSQFPEIVKDILSI